jgi:8-oxo-dGTP diphosphatase
MNKPKKVAKAIIKKDGKILLLKRTSVTQRYPNQWDFVGGRLEVGEKPVDAVVREVKEETALDIIPGDEICLHEHIGNKRHLLFHYFCPLEVRGEIVLSHEHVDFGWFVEDELGDLDLHPAVRLFFGIIFQHPSKTDIEML